MSRDISFASPSAYRSEHENSLDFKGPLRRQSVMTERITIHSRDASESSNNGRNKCGVHS